MIVGVGTDICDIRRISRSLEKFGDRFVGRILLQQELRSSITAAYLARQFAAKEAVSKTLGTGMRNGVHFKNIQVLRSSSGQPIVLLLDSARELADRLNISDIQISLSDEKDFAIAFAIASA